MDDHVAQATEIALGERDGMFRVLSSKARSPDQDSQARVPSMIRAGGGLGALGGVRASRAAAHFIGVDEDLLARVAGFGDDLRIPRSVSRQPRGSAHGRPARTDY